MKTVTYDLTYVQNDNFTGTAKAREFYNKIIFVYFSINCLATGNSGHTLTFKEIKHSYQQVTTEITNYGYNLTSHVNVLLGSTNLYFAHGKVGDLYQGIICSAL